VAASHHGDTPYSGKAVTSVPVTPYTTSVDVNGDGTASGHEGCAMQEAAVVLSVLRERGRRGLPCTQLYRQMFNKDLYLLYGNIYPNKGAMTPGSGGETADGMSEGKIDQIIELMRHER
jgi:hypothetical protein